MQYSKQIRNISYYSPKWLEAKNKKPGASSPVKLKISRWLDGGEKEAVQI